MIKKIENILEKKYIVFAIIAVWSLIIYINSFSAPFTLDDFGSIVNNHSIRNPLNLFAIWKFYSNRFVLYFTFSINYIIHSTFVEGYHITNIAIHILNGFLVYLIIYYILGLKHFSGKVPAKYRCTVSILASLIFVSHPVQVNAVTYVVQRTAALAAMFYFLCILFYIKFRIYDKTRYFLLTLLFTIIAMFTKENTITIPFMLAILELMFFLKDGKTSWRKRISFLFILFLTVPIIPSTDLYLGGYSQSDPKVSFKASTGMDRMQYFYTELNVMVVYIKQLFLPFNLNFDYSNDFPMSKTIWENYSYVSFAALSLIGLTALLNAKRNKLISLGILWFFVGLAVESSFISIKDVYFEHRLYFPVAGFVIFLIGVVFMEFKHNRRLYIFKKPMLYFIVLTCSMIVTYSMITLDRNYIFSDSIRLWSDVVKKAPLSDRAHCVLGTNYLDAYDSGINKKPEYLDLAEKEFKKSIDLSYGNSTSHCNLAKVYLLEGDYDKCISESNVTNSMGESVYAYNNLGSAYEKLGKSTEALYAYLDGYKVDKESNFILKSLGNIYYNNKDFENAKFYYKEFLKYNIYSDSKEIQKKLDEISK